MTASGVTEPKKFKLYRARFTEAVVAARPLLNGWVLVRGVPSTCVEEMEAEAFELLYVRANQPYEQ